jgi:hypothetical protein
MCTRFFTVSGSGTAKMSMQTATGPGHQLRIMKVTRQRRERPNGPR